MSGCFVREWRENKSSASRLHRACSCRIETDASDRLVRLAEIVAWARHALDSPAAARTWLRMPHGLLGGESPLEHTDTTVGMAAVKTMLYHIEYGMPA